MEEQADKQEQTHSITKNDHSHLSPFYIQARYSKETID